MKELPSQRGREHRPSPLYCRKATYELMIVSNTSSNILITHLLCMFANRVVRLLKVSVSSLTPTITATGFLLMSIVPDLMVKAAEANPNATTKVQVNELQGCTMDHLLQRTLRSHSKVDGDIDSQSFLDPLIKC